MWLGVPLGKLNSERMVPLDATTIAASIVWPLHGVGLAAPR
jgi:hypothetical protein